MRGTELKEEGFLHDLLSLALPWFFTHQRDLPWRHTDDPYRIWISEIMLQQTRVEAVKPYYARFLSALPTLGDLAYCLDDRLMKLWEGLGYYSRARNLKKAAGIIVSSFGGIFPRTYEEILSLPGIGPYTAGSISSIAFGLPHAAIDGNALRILARARDDHRDIDLARTRASVTREVDRVLEEVTSEEGGEEKRISGAVNQAMMEIGATVCLPRGGAECGRCPWADLCRGRKKGTVDALPVRTEKKPRHKEKKTVLLIREGRKGPVLLRKRPPGGLLAGLYEFPNLPGFLSEEEARKAAGAMGYAPVEVRKLPDAKHIFTHIEWEMRGYEVIVKPSFSPDPAFFSLETIQRRMSVPSAFRTYMKALFREK